MPAPLLAMAIPYLAAAIPSLISLFRGGGNDSQRSARDLQGLLQNIPQLREMMELQAGRARRTDPLHAASVQMATNLLPRSALTNYPGRPNALFPQR